MDGSLQGFLKGKCFNVGTWQKKGTIECLYARVIRNFTCIEAAPLRGEKLNAKKDNSDKARIILMNFFKRHQ